MSAVLRPTFLAVLLGTSLLATSPLLAQDQTAGSAATTHDQAVQTAPGKFIQELGDQAISIVADKSISEDARGEKFRGILKEDFDLMTIGRFVIGRTWNSATPEQQKEYMDLFERLVVKTYGDRLTLYTGEGFRVTGERQESEKDSIVTSQITHPDGSQPTSIDWRLRQRNGKLGVIDVMVEGVSLSVTQRQEYSSVIQNNGGQIDALLTLMHQQLEAPGGGAGANPAG